MKIVKDADAVAFYADQRLYTFYLLLKYNSKITTNSPWRCWFFDLDFYIIIAIATMTFDPVIFISDGLRERETIF